MRTFLKFIISIILLCVIGGTIYYFMILNENIEDKPSDPISNIEKPKDEQEPIVQKTVAQIMQEINTFAGNIDAISYAENLQDNVGLDILGNTAASYMEFFVQDTIGVNVVKKQNSIMIIPAPDFVDSQAFYFNDEGKLILYKQISNTIGGEAKNYFDNDVLIATEISQAVGEDAIYSPMQEDSNEIITRANRIYEKYMKQK